MIAIRKAGYSFRIEHLRFVRRYGVLLKKNLKEMQAMPGGYTGACRAIAELAAAQTAGTSEGIAAVQVGKTKMFLRNGKTRTVFEDMRERVMWDSCVNTQRRVRGILGRHRFRKMQAMRQAVVRASDNAERLDPHDRVAAMIKAVENAQPLEEMLGPLTTTT